MPLRRWTWIVLLLIVAALLAREIGWLDWSAYSMRSRAESSLVTVDHERPGDLRVRGYDENWDMGPPRDVTLPGAPGTILRYASAADYPWTRWLPVFKFGETKVQERFTVLSAGQVVLSGKRVTRVSLRVWGPISARGYGKMATADVLSSLQDSVRKELADQRKRPTPAAAPATPAT